MLHSTALYLPNLTAAEIADRYTNDPRLPGVDYLLTSRHYPPLPAELAPTLLAAADYINACLFDCVYPGSEIALPDGIRYRGYDRADAWTLLEAHHAEYLTDIYPTEYLHNDCAEDF